MKSYAEDKRISPFLNIDYQPLPPILEERYGNDQLRTVMEFQVGMATNELNPKIMRTDRSGLWLGRRRFVNDPNKPAFDPSKLIAFQVDMEGNVVASSYKTNISGRRVEILNDEIDIFDAAGARRMVISSNNSSIEFYDETETYLGQIFASNTPQQALFFVGVGTIFMQAGTDLILKGTTNISFIVNGNVWSLWDFALDNIFFFKPIVLADFTADPPVQDGAMYYNSFTGKIRGCESGAWFDMI